jgi:hypothetical protein
VSGILWAILALGLHLWPGVVKPAQAQGSRKDDIVFNTRGVPLAGATVRVCAMPASGQPCAPLASIYSDAALTQALANPTVTDGLGNYYFYAAPGQYEIEISGPGITTKQIPNVVLPSDPSSPTFSSINSTGGISAFSLSLTGNLTVNGSTSVVGNLASGTMTLSNQGTSPGAASPGTVNLYTKSTDKRLYYKDDTGTEIGPIASASGAQTNQPNTFTAPQNIDADFHTKGPNPWLDITRYGGYIGPNGNAPATTCSISASSTAASCASASDFVNGNGILILGAGPAPVIATPQTPTVTPLYQAGSTTRSYCVADRDWYGGLTPCSGVGSTSTAPASMSLASYAIASWSFNASTHTYTVTTGAAHNMPTSSSGISSAPFAQIEIQSGTTNNRGCEGAFSLTAVPSTTTFQFQRNDLAADLGCSGGTMRIQPQIMLKWDSHYSYAVQSASCSGGTATVTVSPGLFGPNGTWVVPWNIKAVVAGVTDAHYNGTWTIANYGSGNTTLQYSLGSCTGVSNVGAGGTVSVVPGKAVKNHLIYACNGASCALPGNAANYSLVGVATGNDGYFVDNGWGVSALSVDAGDAPATAPTAALNGYLDTTIVAGGGTTSLTLANAATNSVSSAKTWHDNVPNLLAACAALPANTGNANNGHIVVPATSSLYWYFPIIANFDMSGNYGQSPRNCPGVTIDLGPTTWLDGAILLGKGDNLEGGYGGTNCQAAFYTMGLALSCMQGYSYPMLYFEPEQSSSNYLKDLEINPTQSYQSGIYLDEQLDGDGTTALRFDNTHVDGGINSYPVVDKAGFGRFWNLGGWSTAGGNFSQSRDYIFQPNCGMPNYLVNGSMPYIMETRHTYSFGTMVISECGQSNGNFGSTMTFNDMLTEGPAGPAVLVNTLPYGLSNISFYKPNYADFTGGYATPYFDLTNAGASSIELNYIGCASGYQPVTETNSANTYGGVHVKLGGGACSAGTGFPANAGVVTENLQNNQVTWSGTNLSVTGNGKVSSGQIAAPSVAPTVTVSTSCAGFPTAGTYTYGVIVWDASSNPSNGTGGYTQVSPASSGVSLDGATQCAVISQPPLPEGAVYWGVERLSGPGAGNMVYMSTSYCGPAFTSVSNLTITDQRNVSCGGTPVGNNSALHLMNPNGIFGAVYGSTLGTESNCSTTASPANCGTSPAGLVQVGASATTLTVNTTAVTSNSRFAFTYVTTGTGCSPAPANIGSLLPPYVSGISAGTSFTITLPVAPTTNPVCVSYTLEN